MVLATSRGSTLCMMSAAPAGSGAAKRQAMAAKPRRLASDIVVFPPTGLHPPQNQQRGSNPIPFLAAGRRRLRLDCSTRRDLAPVVGLRLSVILLLAVVRLRLLPIIRLGVITLPVSALAVIRLLPINGRRLGRQLLSVTRLLLAITRRWRRAIAWLLLLAVTGLLLAITRRRLLVVARRRLRRVDGFVVRQAE